MAKKKATKTKEEQRQEWRDEVMGEPKFVVVYPYIPAYSGLSPSVAYGVFVKDKDYIEPNPYERESKVFDTAEEAVRFALQHKDARVYGTLPEYELHYHLKAKE